MAVVCYCLFYYDDLDTEAGFLSLLGWASLVSTLPCEGIFVMVISTYCQQNIHGQSLPALEGPVTLWLEVGSMNHTPPLLPASSIVSRRGSSTSTHACRDCLPSSLAIGKPEYSIPPDCRTLLSSAFCLHVNLYQCRHLECLYAPQGQRPENKTGEERDTTEL